MIDSCIVVLLFFKYKIFDLANQINEVYKVYTNELVSNKIHLVISMQ